MTDRVKVRDLQAPHRARAYLAATAERPVLLLAATEEDTERYAKDAQCFTDEPVVRLPSRDVPYGDRRAMVSDAWGNLWQIATRK